MKQDTLKQYTALRHSLTAEKGQLEARLKAINQALTGTIAAPAKAPVAKKTMSAAARAKISAALKARWAKIKAAKKPVK